MIGNFIKNNINGFFIRIFQGLIIGTGGVLPGVSGGVLCVIFGIYKPFMDVLSSPRKNLKKHLPILIPALIGMGIGFVLLVGAVSSLMKGNSEIATCLFAGLILGTIPSLMKSAGESKRTRSSYIALLAGFVFFFSLLMYLGHGVGIEISPNWLWYFFIGAIFGISVVFPGLSAASILIFLGLLEPMLEGVKSFDFGVLIPIGLGSAISVIMLAKLVSKLFEKYNSVMTHLIVGIVVATTIPIIPVRFTGFANFIVDFAVIILGLVIAFFFDKLSQKFN